MRLLLVMFIYVHAYKNILLLLLFLSSLSLRHLIQCFLIAVFQDSLNSLLALTIDSQINFTGYCKKNAHQNRKESKFCSIRFVEKMIDADFFLFNKQYTSVNMLEQ